MALDLTLADTKELLKEILQRCDAALITIYRDLNDKEYDVSTITKGSALEVLGLTRFVQEHVEGSVWKDEEEPSE